MSQRFPPKKARPTGRKTDCHDTSFHEKTGRAPTSSKISREWGLTLSQGSIVTIEYPRQGHPEGGQHEAWIEIESLRPQWEYPRLR
jgi:hypothetical protein